VDGRVQVRWGKLANEPQYSEKGDYDVVGPRSGGGRRAETERLDIRGSASSIRQPLVCLLASRKRQTARTPQWQFNTWIRAQSRGRILSSDGLPSTEHVGLPIRKFLDFLPERWVHWPVPTTQTG